MSTIQIGMRGDYVMPAIPPNCKELRVPATLIEIRTDGTIVLQDDWMLARHGKHYQIHTGMSAFVPHGSEVKA